LAKVFSLVNPPPGFTITNTGEIQVDPLAPPFSGLLNVACTTGTANTTATIEFNWLIPVKSPLFSETGELVSMSGSSATIVENLQVLDGILQSISGSIAELEEIGVSILTARSGSIATIGEPGVIASGLEWSFVLWTAGYAAVTDDYAQARAIEVYYPIGPTPSPTDFNSIVCIPALKPELLAAVRARFNDNSWAYSDCVDARPGDATMQATTPYSAIYSYERP
jgi:hypothetical protein